MWNANSVQESIANRGVYEKAGVVFMRWCQSKIAAAANSTAVLKAAVGNFKLQCTTVESSDSKAEEHTWLDENMRWKAASGGGIADIADVRDSGGSALKGRGGNWQSEGIIEGIGMKAAWKRHDFFCQWGRRDGRWDWRGGGWTSAAKRVCSRKKRRKGKCVRWRNCAEMMTRGWQKGSIKALKW